MLGSIPAIAIPRATLKLQPIARHIEALFTQASEGLCNRSISCVSKYDRSDAGISVDPSSFFGYPVIIINRNRYCPSFSLCFSFEEEKGFSFEESVEYRSVVEGTA